MLINSLYLNLDTKNLQLQAFTDIAPTILAVGSFLQIY